MDKQTNSRPPIVTVLGHVDHGKTSLLDGIRKTNVADKEAGGITQGIGASVVETVGGKRITFIDTPGHAAFAKMRQRGAKVADIAILVVAGEDGVKPQTLEALSAIKEAKVPFVVAITKMDLPTATSETVLGQLEKEGVLFEGRGGEVSKVEVSARKGTGITELLETISLVSEVHGLEGTKDEALEAVVIESSKEKMGPVASVVVRKGTLKVGQEVFVHGIKTKIKGLFDWKGVRISEVLPGEPAKILGFSELQDVGTVVSQNEVALGEMSQKKVLGKIEKGKTPIIVRAKNTGGLEAVLGSIPEGFVCVDSGVGDINESDILNAKSSKAYVFAFESQIPRSVLRLAEAEGVLVERFDIIYELIQRLSEILKEGVVEVLGKAQILASFPFNKRQVAGCKVVTGRILKTDKLALYRNDKKLADIKALSLKKQKAEINEAKQGEEFGILMESEFPFEIGDVILAARNG